MANMRTTAILKTDIVDSTPRTAQFSQTEMGYERKQHKRFIAEISAQNDGSIFQEEGDAFWIRFPSVTTAVLAAIEMHQTLRAMQAGKGEKWRLSIRAVVTVGDILFQDNDTMGLAMSLTARIEKITPPDEIYLSHAAWLVMNKAEIQTSFVQEFTPKGFKDPERVYKVDQKYRSRQLTNQYIVFTDAKGFTPFVKAADVEQVESFLIECDDLIHAICEKYNGIIRQVNGDQYFITFSECAATLSALQELCEKWERICEHYGVGLSIGVHKGNLNVIRSYVYGDDIHTTVFLSGFDRSYESKPNEIWVIASRKIVEEMKSLLRVGQILELEGSRLTRETEKVIFQQHGAYRLILNR